MEKINKRVFSEVIEVLDNTEDDVVKKIPQKFINFLNENKDTNYKPNINFDDEHWEDTVEEDTRALLALIYRDYVVSDEERLKLLQEEKEEELKMEAELREKYNPDNMFKKSENKNKPNETLKNTELTEIKETSWFRRVFKRIFEIFGKK